MNKFNISEFISSLHLSETVTSTSIFILKFLMKIYFAPEMSLTGVSQQRLVQKMLLPSSA
jgi:hypothetical protein